MLGFDTTALVVAYVDPTGGGLLLQILLGGSAGVIVFVKLLGRAIFRRGPRRPGGDSA